MSDADKRIARLEAEVKLLTEAALAVIARLEREDDPAWDSPSELDALTAALAADERVVGKPAPDYNPKVDHPERYSDGPY